jgi:trk system potassium uptake protein TrkA
MHMRIIIIGCGRMGAGLALTMSQRGHAVAVVDRDPTNFERLGSSFKGEVIEGVGLDRKVLLAAGIERADGLAALTASDDVNVVVGRIASEVFRVPRVVARLYDPRKANIYGRLGLHTISPTIWGINQAAEVLCYSPLDAILNLGSGEVNIVTTEIPPLLVGQTVSELTVRGEIHVVAISRGGRVFLPTLGTEFSWGDVVYLVVLATSSDRLRALLGLT